MNTNYNLMRLANLYGGMNKYAADFSGMEIKPGSPQHKALVDLLANKQITQEQFDNAIAGGRIDVGGPIHQAWVGTLPNTAPANDEELAARIAANKAMFENVKGPGLLDKSMAWIKENPILAGAIGAGTLGLGGYGAYKALSDDEEEERRKSASYIDPYTAQVLAHDYITKMARANGIPSVAAGVTGIRNYLNY